MSLDLYRGNGKGSGCLLLKLTRHPKKLTKMKGWTGSLEVSQPVSSGPIGLQEIHE